MDTKKEHLAIDEAQKLGIPVIGILDTNCDPDEIAYPIPGNDDAIRSAALLTKVVAEAAAAGLIARSGRNGAAVEGEDKPEPSAAEEPLPEWERDLLVSATADAGDAPHWARPCVAGAEVIAG